MFSIKFIVNRIVATLIAVASLPNRLMRFTSRLNTRRLVLAVLASLLIPLMLTACSSGGGSSNTPPVPAPTSPPPPPPPPPPAPDMPFPRPSPAVTIPPDPSDFASRKSEFEAADEYEVSYYRTSESIERVDNHLGLIKAAAAYARGATGAGETIVVVDSGIDASHPELSGKVRIVTGIGDSCSPADAAAGQCAGAGHGTAVASLVAGHRSGVSSQPFNIQGVAFDAQITFIPVRLGDSTPNPDLPPLLELNAYTWEVADRPVLDSAAEYLQYINEGAILNYSFGRSWSLAEWRQLGSNCESSGDETGPYACYKYYYRANANALAQTSKDPADRSIVVIAAGNTNGDRHDLNSRNDNLGPLIDPSSPNASNALAVAFNAPGDPDLAHVIAVVAVGAEGRIASYSNRCGLAKSFCIAAPGGDSSSGRGVEILHASPRGGYGISQGTSFAAPVVSGSLAVLRQFFRGQLGNTEVVNRLLATADRSDYSPNGGVDYSDSDTYGHGLVDLDAATSPVGPVMTSLSSDPRSRPLAGTRTALSGGAFGTAWQRGLADVEMAGFDALDAPFFMPASSWVMHATRLSDAYPERHELSVSAYQAGSAYSGKVQERASLSLGFDGGREIADARLSFADGWWLSYGDQAGRSLGLHAQDALPFDAEGHHGKNVLNHFSDALAFASPYLSLVRDGPGIGWAGSGRFSFALMQGTPQFDGYHRPGGQRGLGAVLDLQLGSGLWLQAGALREREGFLGARLQGALGEVQAATHFVGFNGAWVLGARSDAMGDALGDALGNNVGDPSAWRLLASAYLGRTRPQVHAGGLVQGVDTLTSSAFSIGAVRSSLWRRDDWLGLRLSQPLRTEEASLRMHLPTGRTRYGELLSQDYNVNLAPAGRHLQAEAVYHLPLAGGTLEASLGAERHPQHDRTRGIQPFMRFSFSRDL